jgi:hypothetical protein
MRRRGRYLQLAKLKTDGADLKEKVKEGSVKAINKNSQRRKRNGFT